MLIPAGLRRRSERGSFSLLGLGQGFADRASRGRSHNPDGGWASPLNGPYQGGPVAPISRSWGMATPSPIRAHRSRASRNLRRQRQIVSTLTVIAGLTLMLSFVPGLATLLAVHLLADVLLALYIVALLRRKEMSKHRVAPAAAVGAAPWADANRRVRVATPAPEPNYFEYRRAVGE